ncbi:MAG: transporter substrate-binding domain-containing protein [Desulfobacterales bacterium]|nr:transporter substrate-binding domain-containing protein [Desulfobacterales bacterium]
MKSFLLILIFSLICFTVDAKEKIVTVATLNDYAPYCFADQHYKVNQIIPKESDAKSFKGYSWEVLRESFHEMGYTINISITPWARAMSNFKGGSVDILFPTGKNSERQKIFDYSEESVNEAVFLVYLLKGNEFKWNGLKSLKNLRIGVKRGFNYGNKWNSETSIIKYEVTTILQGIKMLSLRRLDGFLGYEDSWDYILKKKKWSYKFVKFPSFDSSSEYLVTLKKNLNGKELLKAFDTGKKRIIKNGKLNKIKVKWFSSK